MKEVRHYLDKYMANPKHPLTILVVGAGGTGSNIMTGLIRIHQTLLALDHIGLKVTLIDNDSISPANIGRQNFFPCDLGRNKAEVLIERINRTYGTEWLYKTTSVQNIELTYNVIITCTDNVDSRRFIKERKSTGSVMEFSNFYWIDCGNSKNSGQVILGSNLIKQPKSEKYGTVAVLKDVFDLYPDLRDDGDNTPSCSTAEAISRQSLFVNSFIANFACQMLWDLLKYNYIDYHGIFFNLTDLEITKIKL